MYIDKFKINWTEYGKESVTTSATGYQYQIDSWKAGYFKKFSKADFKTKILATIPNVDGTVTITVSREL